MNADFSLTFSPRENIFDDKLVQVLLLYIKYISYFLLIINFLSAQEVLETFDEQIQGVCLQVNDIIDRIQNQVPEWQPSIADRSIVMDTS